MLVRWFAAHVLRTVGPGDIDGRDAVDSRAGWQTPGARALTWLYVGGESGAGLAWLLDLVPANGDAPWPPPREQLPPEQHPGAAAVRHTWERVRTYGVEPSHDDPDTRASLLALAWPCGVAQRRAALLQVGVAPNICDRLVSVTWDEALASLAAQGASAGPAADAPAEASEPDAHRSPLHRWTWQRVVLFCALVFASIWVYVLDK